MTGVAILGAGMAGFGAAARLRAEGVDAVVYEKKPYYGGHTATFKFDGGYLFDDGPHISFTSDERIQKVFAANVDQRYEVLQARVNNHWRGHWIKHPAQCNLHGLPEDLVVAVLKDFIEAQGTEPGEIDNYEQWLLASYGRTFAETFPMEYTVKYHTTEAKNLATDWLGPRLYRPDLEEVLRGALSSVTKDIHYVDKFRYPTEGGFQAYVDSYPDLVELRLEHEVTGIDLKARELRFAGGERRGFERLVSSLPLPALIPLVDGAPADVLAAVEQLAWSSCVIVNLAIDREELSDCQWTYFYDRDFTLTRLNYPHMLSPNNTPPGVGSLQGEVYFSRKYRPFEGRPEDYVEPVIADLRRCGKILPNDKILFKNAAFVPYANVIFDHDRKASLATVHGYLDDVGIAYCGRYGEWGYHWTDEAFKSGEVAAEKVLDGSP